MPENWRNRSFWALGFCCFTTPESKSLHWAQPWLVQLQVMGFKILFSVGFFCFPGRSWKPNIVFVFCACLLMVGMAGIMFQDITTLLLDPKAFKDTIDLFVERYKGKNISVVAGEYWSLIDPVIERCDREWFRGRFFYSTKLFNNFY